MFTKWSQSELFAGIVSEVFRLSNQTVMFGHDFQANKGTISVKRLLIIIELFYHSEALQNDWRIKTFGKDFSFICSIPFIMIELCDKLWAGAVSARFFLSNDVNNKDSATLDRPGKGGGPMK